jgi:hypothetical protein
MMKMSFVRTALVALVAFLAPVIATLAYHAVSIHGESPSGVAEPLVGKVLFFTSPG